MTTLSLRLAVIAALAACGGATTSAVTTLPAAKASDTPAASAPAAPAAPPALFAPLFVEGAFKLARDESIDDDAGHRVNHEPVDCTIEHVVTRGTTISSELACSGEGSPNDHLELRPDGLYRGEGADAELLLPREPVAWSKTQPDPTDPELGDTDRIYRDGAMWCHEQASSIGDPGGYEYCFEAGVGLARFHDWFDGGMTRDTTLTRVR